MELGDVAVEIIFSFLSLKDLANSLCVCSQWKAWLDGGKLSDRIWKTVAYRKFGGPPKTTKGVTSSKIQTKVILSEYRRIVSETAAIRLKWAIASGHGNYAASLWNNEMKGTPIAKSLPDIKKVIPQAIAKGHFTIAEWCAEVLQEELKEEFQWTPVLINCIKKNAPIKFIFSILNKYIPDINKQDKNESLLSVAIYQDNIELIKFLLSRNVSLLQIAQDLSAFHVAVNHGNIDILEILKKHCIETEGEDNFKENINRLARVKHTEQTPLHFACSKDQFESVKWLVASGASYVIPNSIREYPLHLSVMHSPRSFFFLSESGADLYQTGEFHDEMVQAIHIAVAYFNIDIVQYILNKTDSVDFSKFDTGDQPVLFYANANCTLINLLLDSGADPLVTYETNRSDCERFSTEENIKVLERLKDAGLPIIPNQHGVTPFLYALNYCGNLDVIKWFVERGNSSVHDISNGKTAFHAACDSKCDKQVFDYLVSKGVDIHAVDAAGDNGLHILAGQYMSCPELLSHLLSLGLKDIPNGNGETAFILALANGSIDNVKVLVEEGKVDLNQTNANGETVLEIINNLLFNKNVLLDYFKDKFPEAK